MMTLPAPGCSLLAHVSAILREEYELKFTNQGPEDAAATVGAVTGLGAAGLGAAGLGAAGLGAAG